MKFSKKVLSLGLATAMVAGSAVSFAIPNNTVVLDTNKAYDLDIFFGDLPQDVVDAIAAADGIWFDADGSGYMDAFTGTAMTQAQQDALTNISYMNEDGSVDTYATFASETPVEENLTVESVSAINSTTVEVTFDNGTVKQYTVDAMTPGVDNTVTFTEGEQTFTATVTDYEALVATSIVVSTNRIQDAAAQALDYTVFDQYGEEMTVAPGALTTVAYNVTTSTNIGSIANISTFNISAGTAVDDVVKFTVYLTANPAVKVVKEVEVSNINIAGITLEDPTVPANAERITVGQTGVVMEYTATDDNGDAYTLSSSSANKAAIEAADNVIIDLTNITGVSTNASGDLLLNLSGSTAGDATIKITIPSTGEIVTKTFTVNAVAGQVATMTLAEEAKTIAAGTTAYIDMAVADNYGTTLAPADYAAGTYNIVSSNPSVVANAASLKINNTPGNANYGKLEVPVTVGATEGATATVTITSATGTVYDTLVVTAGAAPIATDAMIAENSAHNTNLIVGSTTTLGVTVNDQYGNAITADGAYQVNYTVMNSATAITVDAATDTNESAASVVVTAAAAGTATLKVELVKTADSSVVDYFTVPFTVVANSSTGLTYTVADITTLYELGADINANDGAIDATEVAAGYVKEVSVTAKDASGNVYTIPSSEIVNVTTDSTAVNITKVSGKWYVGGTGDVTEDTTATLNVIFNATDGVQTITKDVVVSKDALKAQSVAFKDAAYGAVGANDVTTITIDDAAGYAADIASNVGTGTVYLWVEDQFGGYELGETASNYTLGFASVDGFATDTDSIALAAPQDGSLTITDAGANVSFTKEDASFRVVAYTANGKTDFIDVTVTDGVLPAVASSAIVNATTVDITFNDTVDETSAEAAAYTVATADGTDTETLTSATLQADGKTVRLVFGSANIASADTVTVPVTVQDDAGNVPAAPIVVTLP